MGDNASVNSLSNNDRSFFGKDLLNESKNSINQTKNSSVENDYKK